jgi:hypothetical protein
MGRSRTVIVGDVHGCARELDALLDRIAFSLGDRLVFVGDLIARGPDSLGVLDIARTTGAVIVRGNHEEKILSWRAKKQSHLRGIGKRPDPLGRTHARVARSLRPIDWTLLATSPCFYDLPEHGARVVHAGILPNVPFEDQKRQTLMRIRNVSARGEWLEKGNGGSELWGKLYAGPPHIVFGHNAMPDPQLHRWATGIDTACVYGGRLTAMVLDEGQRIPRGRDALGVLVSQPAARVYFDWKKTPPAHETMKQKRVA